LAPVLFGVCLTGPGCQFCYEIKRNLINEPLYCCDQVAIRMRHERLAKQAWDEMVQQYGCTFSDDYRRGFIDGFVDYLTYGGCVNGCEEGPFTPPVPPEHYRHKGYMTPEGYRAIEEWFMGFRHGASTAAASGLRQLVVIPVMNPPRFGDYDPAADHHTGPPAEGLKTLPHADGQMLPTPRSAPEAPMPPAANPPPGGGGAPPPPN
jgi:hypothetical protein